MSKNPGVQHTAAVCALTMSQICLNMISLQEGDQLYGYCSKIQKTILECRCDTLTNKHPSKKGRAAVQRMCAIIDEYIGNEKLVNEIVSNGWIYNLWGAMVVCASGFCLDILTSAPIYSAKLRWRKLYALVNGLSRWLIKYEANIEDWGLLIYERAAWAMDDVIFPVDSRERLLGKKAMKKRAVIESSKLI